MNASIPLNCDGCGQPADSQHIAIRLQRLEWATRYRPVHIHTLLLSGVSPTADAEFLYAPEGEFQGEAQRVLEIAGISFAQKSREVVHAEFQRAGFFLAHLLECPGERASLTATELRSRIEKRVPTVITRIRRSLKPRRVVLIAEDFAPVVGSFSANSLECPIVLDNSLPFATDGKDSATVVARLKEALAATPAAAR